VTLLASPALFASPDGLYWNPADGSSYRRYPFFADRVDALKQRFAPNGQALLIAGCAFGYLVDQARQAGYNAWGCDGSAWAVSQAVVSQVQQADVLVPAQLDAVANAAGLRGNPPRWDLLVTEDLLTCLTDAEIPTALANLRARCRANLAHLVTPLDPATTQDPRITWKSYADWKAIVSPPDVLLGENGQAV
jgi:hypothetical protein